MDFNIERTGNKVNTMSACIPDAQNYAESQGSILVESSAKTAVNITALFTELSKYAIHNLIILHIIHDKTT